MKLSNLQIFKFTNLLLLLLLPSCNPNYDLAGFLNGTSPEVCKRFEQSIAYNDSVGVPAVIVPSADYRVYVCTDSHIDSIPTNLTTFVQAAAADTLCPFALHLGDLVNAQGHIPYAVSLLQDPPLPLLQREGESLAPIVEGNLSPLPLCRGSRRGSHPYLAIALGNHDIYFNQWDEWRSYFGTSVYWFYTMLPDSTVLDRFICLDSAEGTLGTAQLQWLRELLTENGSQPSTLNAQPPFPFRHTIVFTHTHLFRRDHSQRHTSNYAIEETYELTSLLEQGGVDMYWCGHDHSREITDYAGFTSIVVDAIEDHYPPAFYMVATLSDQINYRFIQLP
ncbi:MAG: metallophosphoesterase [Paludibacteraceae bacterium]|nr:metallophosphoesterase [Paludibacteraceae bacterium]